MSTMTIGQVVQKTGTGMETIRFYERKGLIRKPARRANGYRQYTDEHITQLLFIKQAKVLGFSLNEISELLSIRSGTTTECNYVKRIAAEKLDDIEARIKMLQRMRRTLKKLVNECPGQGPIEVCPILDALDS